MSRQQGFQAAILGSGRMANRYAAILRRNPRVGSVAAWGRNAEALERMRKRFGIDRLYQDYETLLAQAAPEVVLVCLPPHLRKEYIIPALAKGAHVFCEKPLSLSAAEGREMVEAARSANRRLAVSYTLRYLPEIAALKERLRAGALGEIKRLSIKIFRSPRSCPWLSDRAISAGVRGELAIHAIDLIRWLLDREPSHTRYRGLNVRDNLVDDSCFLEMEFPGGCFATADCSMSSPFFATEIAVEGSAAGAQISRGRLIVRKPAIDRPAALSLAVSLLDGIALPWHYARFNPYRAQLEEFFDRVRPAGDDRDESDFELRTLEIFAGLAARA